MLAKTLDSSIFETLARNLTKVYPSTGQTWRDILQISTLYPGNLSAVSPQELLSMIPRAFLDADYVPPDRAVYLITTHTIPYAIAVGAVLLRLYARRRKLGKWLLEDYMIIIAIALSFPFMLRSVLGPILYRWGREVPDMTAHNLFMTIKVTWFSSMLWPLPMVFVRLSLVLFFRRLYSKTDTRMISYSNVLMVIFCVIAVAAVLLFAFSCTPVESAYDVWKRPHGKCETGSKTASVVRILVVVVGALNLAVDLMILFIPIRLIWKIACSGWRKAEYITLLGLGILAWGFNIAAIVTFYHAGQTSLRKMWAAELYTYLHTIISIVCSCAPAIRTLFQVRTLKSVSHLVVPGYPIDRTRGRKNLWSEDSAAMKSASSHS